MPRIASKEPGYPLFKNYSLSELADRLPYRESYLLEIKMGRVRPTDRFRATATGILNMTNEALFGSERE